MAVLGTSPQPQEVIEVMSAYSELKEGDRESLGKEPALCAADDWLQYP
jgi:hypothetical protein